MRIKTIVLVFTATLAACSEPSDAPNDADVAADTGGTAVVALLADLDYANILAASDKYTQEVLRYVLFLPLVQYDSALGYEPALARSFELEGDSAVTFKLRDDVHWHDGQKTTAYDVQFTFERAADTTTAFPNADWLVGWSAPQVIDSFTVRFRIQRMADPLASVALLPIMPRHLLDSVPAARTRQAQFNNRPVGNGPFRFVEHRADDRWVFEANREFPEGLGGRPRLSRLVLRVIPNPTAQIAELRAGNVDLAFGTPADQFKQLDSDSALRGISRPSRQYAFIAWNTRRPPLDDARVRKAIAMAMDRQEMIDLVRAGRATLALSPVGEYHWAYHRQLRPLPYSVDSARALLAQAGWQDRNGDGIAEDARGKTLRIELKTIAQSAAMSDLSTLIQSDLRAAGVELVVRPLDFGTLNEQISDPKRPFDAAMLAWENDVRLNLRDMFHSAAINGPFQFASYRNAEVDRIIDEASAEPDPARARPLWHRFQEIMREEQPWTILFHTADLFIARERLQGVDMDIRGAFVNVQRWYVQ